jgi:hypothetical protein
MRIAGNAGFVVSIWRQRLLVFPFMKRCAPFPRHHLLISRLQSFISFATSEARILLSPNPADMGLML